MLDFHPGITDTTGMDITLITVVQWIVCAAGWYFLLTEGARFFKNRH